MTIHQRVLTRLLTIFFTILVFAIYIQTAQPATPIYAHDNGPAAHEGDEGLILAPARAESVYPAAHCPADAPIRAYNVVAIQLAITLNRYLDYDPEGRMYVLEEALPQVRQEEAQNATARKDGGFGGVSLGLQGDAIQPLVLRVNQGECLQITLRNDLPAPEAVTLHLHGSGLYVQGSGPPALTGNAEAIIAPGVTITYTWWVSPDEPEGTHYFHSHADERFQTGHGLFGAVIVEPQGAHYHDPRTGQALPSGWDAIIAPPAGDAFREFVIIYHEIGNERYRHADRHGRLVTQVDPYTGAYRPGDRAINYRSEPFMNRLQLQQERFGRFDESLVYSSYAFGDPATPLLEAYLGDPLAIRGLVAAANDVHTLHVDGHWFRGEPFSRTSPPVNTVHLGISERYDLVIPRAGGPQQMAGDYLYYNGRAFKLREGSWGLLRVYDQAAKTTLQKLSGHTVIPAAAKTVCPTAAPRKVFDIVAIETPLPMLGKEVGKIYLLQADKAALASGDKAAEPLVLHVNVGDCIIVHLTNETKNGPVSFHADLLAGDPKSALGVEAGFNPPQTVPVGQNGVYTYFAHPEVGETVALVRDWGNVLENPRLGLYGAIIVGPPGATYRDPVTGADLAGQASWRVDVHPPNAPAYRDFTLFLQDEDPVIGTHIMPYSEQVRGVVGLNYGVCRPEDKRTGRQEGKKTGRQEDNSTDLVEDKKTASLLPVFLSSCLLMEAFAGDPLRVHILVPFSEQAHVFTLEGHRWLQEPRPGANLLSAVQVGALEAITIIPIGGANAPGVYRFGDQRAPYREAGLWGLFQVYTPGTDQRTLQPLTVK